MDPYGVTLQAAVANPRTIGNIIASTARTGHLDALRVSFDSPADNAIRIVAKRCTTVGTITAVTPQAKAPASPAASLSANENATVEPTYTANSELYDQYQNQRSILVLVFAPGKEWVTNNTASNGIGVTGTHASATPNCNLTSDWVE